MRRRGFTLLELLVAIGLIAVLGALLLVAVNKIQLTGKRQQTRGIMQNLQAMFAEYDVNRRVPFGMGNLPVAAVAKANQVTLAGALALPCPGNVTSDSGTDRFGFAVQVTRDLMAQLMLSPNMSSAIGKLPSSLLMTFLGNDLFTPSPPPTWSNTTAYTLNYSTAAPTSSVTVVDTTVSPSVNRYYLRTQLYLDSAGNLLQDGQRSYSAVTDPTFLTNSPPNYFYWMPVLLPPTGGTAPLSTPVVLDAWGNPIIFVMGGVLGNPSGATTGFLYSGGTNIVQVNSPDYHPFFASAGPDGDFSKGDDNMYSFEK